MDDLISRKDAIDAISCDITVTGRKNAELVAETIGAFVDRIKALPPAQPDVPDICVGDTISRKAALDAIRTLQTYKLSEDDDMLLVDKAEVQTELMMLSSAQPEQRVEELLSDGTLHLFTDTDLSKVNRVWASQNNTHYGDLYYADEDPKRGKWIPCSERLPEEGERVLATHLGGINPNKQVIEHIYQCGKFTCGWDMDMNVDSPTFGQRYMGEVIAWMPLPEPYTERRGNEND